MKTFYSLEELKPYYNEKTNIYEFVENGRRFDVRFEFRLDVEANITAGVIKAHDINAWDINAWDINACNIDAEGINASDIKASDINARNINARNINAWDINARNINAGDIIYYAVCVAYNNIECTSIRARRTNAKHIALDGEIKIVPRNNTESEESKK